MKNPQIIALIVIVALVAGGAGVFGGIWYQQSKQPAFGRQAGTRGSLGFGGTSGAGFRPVSGQILASDSSSITVKMNDGSSRIVLLSDKTIINKAAAATKDDLKVGETVAVFGQSNSDGSLTAQNIQLNPISTRGASGSAIPQP